MQRDQSFKSVLAATLLAVLVIFATASRGDAQPANAKVAVLTPGLTLQPVLEGLQEGLARQGYVKDKNIVFMVEDTKGNSSDTANLAARAGTLLAAKPDVLVAVSTAHAQAAKQATSTVPIVFAWVGDPVQAGLIARYPYSKTNLTGVAAIGDSLTGKRLEGLLEIMPKVKRLLVVVSSKESVARSSFRSLDQAAKKFGVKLLHRDVTNEEEIRNAIDETPKGSIDAIFHLPSTLVRTHIDLLVKRAKRDRIPLAVHEDALVDRGALVSYGPNSRLIGIQAATLVSKALNGTKPGEIMVENPDRLVLVINRGAAKEIGLTIPPAVLERADRLVD
jgi:putative tryptophan/tyrosine transport system substrate-binding protein